MVGIGSTKVNWIMDADIRSFFDAVSQEWLVRFLEHRIGDQRIIRLIQKWLKAGVLEDGAVTVSETGTGQGSVISPLLANIYLHYVFDLWAERWRRREATGDMIIVRYADDLVSASSTRPMHIAFLKRCGKGSRTFALTLHPDKTRLIEFGRHAAAQPQAAWPRQTGDLHLSGLHATSAAKRAGAVFQLKRKSRRDRMRAKLKEIKEELRWRRCTSRYPEQGQWLRQVVSGFFAYHAVPTNILALATLPTPRHRPLAASAQAAQPERQDDTGNGCKENRRRLASQTPHPSPWPKQASPSNTQGGSRMRESRTYGSVRGALSNGRPYRVRL